jgi:hypothetical protein
MSVYRSRRVVQNRHVPPPGAGSPPAEPEPGTRLGHAAQCDVDGLGADVCRDGSNVSVAVIRITPREDES